jgi:Tfp pilus assembly protein PilE
MRRLQVNRTKGFTLVEVLVISPIVILFIGAFIALAVGLTGETLQLREKNAATYDVQAALNIMETSIVQATGFMSTTSGVQSPQGKNNSATQFTNTSAPDPDTLILNAAATTRRPTDPARSLIYMGTGACNNKNPIYTYTTVYFVDTTTSTLYKRTILPQQPACAQPWQRGSCNANDIAANSTICDAQDEKLLDNVASVTIQYFADATSTTPLNPSLASSATSVSVSITLTKPAGGATISYSSSTRATSLNAQTSEVNTSPPATPAIAWSRSNSTPYQTDFSWDQVGSATGYNIRYRLGSGTWVNGPQNQAPNNTSYSIVGNSRKQNEDIEVSVVTTAGTYLYGTMSTTLPNWNDCTLTNGWQNYSSSYNNAGFTKTTTQFVGLKGLVKLGTIGYSATNVNAVCTLPVGFRPMSRQIFETNVYNPGITNGRGWGRVDVDVDGTVNFVSGTNNGWASLDGIIFATSSASVSWSNPITSGTTFANGWNYSNYGGEDYGTPRYGLDSLGRVWFEGLASPGTVNVSILGVLPASVRPALPMHVPSDAGTSSPVGIINIGSDGTTNARAVNGYRSMQYVYYPSSFNSWKTLSYQNSWHDYGSGWSTGQCYQGSDDIVIVKGLLAGGSVTTNAVLTHLARAIGGSCGTPNTGAALLMPLIASGDITASVDLYANGNVLITNVNAGWTSFDGFHFIAN